MEMRDYSRARWVPLLILVGILAACSPAVTPTADAPKPTANAPTPTPTPAPPPAPTPAAPQASCDDSAITLLDRVDAGIHGAIVADVLHMGGATAPATCMAPANSSLLAGLSIPDDRTAQVQQPRYYLIVVGYPDGDNRLYVVRRGDGTTCVIDTNDECIAQVTDLADAFDVGDLPDDVEPTIPAGRPTAVNPEPAAPNEPVNPGEPGAPSAPGGLPAAPKAAFDPEPRDGATGEPVQTRILNWTSPDAKRWEVYWGTEKNLAADAYLKTPVLASVELVYIQRPGARWTDVWLAGNTTYYWRVDAINDAGTTRGPVWSFTTGEAPAPPSSAEPETGPPSSVAAVTITTPGKGYTTPPEVSLVGGGGSGATAVAVLNGSVTEVTITHRGNGFYENPVLEFTENYSGPYCCRGHGATAYATVTLDEVWGARIDNPGSGYTSPPDVTFSGGGGSGATGRTFLWSEGLCCTQVGAVTVDNPGSGYTSPPDVTFSGGGGSGGAAGTAVLESGGVASVSLTNGGSYNRTPDISFSGGGGSGAAATAALLSGGINGFGMTNKGSGYHSVPTVSFSGGGGSGAAATAFLSGYLSSVVITNGGHSYHVPPQVDYRLGGGGNAQFIAKISGGVAAVFITDRGSGYTSAPSVVFSGGGGSGATAAATLEEE